MIGIQIVIFWHTSILYASSDKLQKIARHFYTISQYCKLDGFQTPINISSI